MSKRKVETYVYHVVLDCGCEGETVEYVFDNEEGAREAAKLVSSVHRCADDVRVDKVEVLSVLPDGDQNDNQSH